MACGRQMKSNATHRVRTAPVFKEPYRYIKELDAGQEISYGGTFCTANPMRVATIPVGYADGYPRGLSNKGDVLIAGKRARILGRVCMDQFMVDVTHVPNVHAGMKP